MLNGIFETYMEIHDGFDYGFGPQMISFAEIQAYAQVSGIRIGLGVANLFREMSRIYMQIWAKRPQKQTVPTFKSAGGVEGLKSIFTKRAAANPPPKPKA